MTVTHDTPFIKDTVSQNDPGVNPNSETGSGLNGNDGIANRVKRGGHDISQEDVIRRFEGRWEAAAKVLPYCDEAEFYDNDNGFVLVAEYRNGELRTVGSRHPQWLAELMVYLDT